MSGTSIIAKISMSLTICLYVYSYTVYVCPGDRGQIRGYSIFICCVVMAILCMHIVI